MNYCAIHKQWYDEYCVYCGQHRFKTITQTTIPYVCEDCGRNTSGRCPKHSDHIYDEWRNIINKPVN